MIEYVRRKMLTQYTPETPLRDIMPDLYGGVAGYPCHPVTGEYAGDDYEWVPK